MEKGEARNIVELIGEDGTPVLFEHLMTLEHGKKRYILVTPVEPETPDEEGAVVIMRIDAEADGTDCYIIEEDEATLDAVFDQFMSIIEDEEDDDEDEEDDPSGSVLH